MLTSSLGATAAEDERRRGRPAKPKPGETPLSDYRYIDRLGYQYNGAGFIDDRESHLWLVDAISGAARVLVSGPSAEAGPAWSPDGTRIAFAANRRTDPDLHWRSGIYAVDVATGEVTTIAGGADATFTTPTWSRDGSAILALGRPLPAVRLPDRASGASPRTAPTPPRVEARTSSPAASSSRTPR